MTEITAADLNALIETGYDFSITWHPRRGKPGKACQVVAWPPTDESEDCFVNDAASIESAIAATLREIKEEQGNG